MRARVCVCVFVFVCVCSVSCMYVRMCVACSLVLLRCVRPFVAACFPSGGRSTLSCAVDAAMELVRALSMRVRPGLRCDDPVTPVLPLEAESQDSSNGALHGGKTIQHRIMSNFNIEKDSMGRRSANAVRQMRDRLAASERAIVVHHRVYDMRRHAAHARVCAMPCCMFDALLCTLQTHTMTHRVCL